MREATGERDDVAGPEAPARLWAFYAGGFLGPFGGAMVTPMLPELAQGLGTTLSTAAWSLTIYLIPFAAVMLVSGTLGEAWGRARTVRSAYLAYVVASLVCALAPTADVFLTGRALQGVANAFTTPLLVAAISDAVPRAGLGRALGRYAGLQAAGQAFAPLVGGAAAAFDYRWAFVVSALAALGLACVPPRDPAPRDAPESGAVTGPGAVTDPAGAPRASRWRALANRRLALACAVAFGLYLSTSGLLLLVALLADDRFGLGPDARGLVVAAFGAAGLATAGVLGRLADRVGLARFGVAALVGLAVTTAVAGSVPAVWLLAVVVAFGGAASTAARVVVNTLAVTSTPANRGGATSMMLSWQFLGSALAPPAFLPVYNGDGRLSLVVAATGSLAAAVLLGITSALRRAGDSATPD
ncbi:MAG: MFS transporter [Kineosporiaceae bacterium]